MSITELLETYKIDNESLIEDLRGELSYLQNFPTDTTKLIKIIHDYKSYSKTDQYILIGSVFVIFSNINTIKRAIIANKACYLTEERMDRSPSGEFFMTRARGICIFYELLWNLLITQNCIIIRQMRELYKYMINLHNQEINRSNLPDIRTAVIWWDDAYSVFVNKRKIAYEGLLDVCIAFYSSEYEYLPPYVILFIIDMFPDNYFSSNKDDLSYFTLARYEKIKLIESVRNYVVKLRNL